jgi:signal transduction histidine kinase/CheY-like chemotaxis protein
MSASVIFLFLQGAHLHSTIGHSASMAKAVGLALGGALFAAAGVAFALWQRAVAPMAQLAEEVSAAAKGSVFSARFSTAEGGELGELAGALNSMLAEIEARTRALEQQHAEMEKHIAERTRELREQVAERTRAEVLARRAKEEAEAANAAKDEFLSRMSHELRTPLNAILGFAQLLEMDPLSDEQTTGVAHILKAGEHLLELVNEVLDISRISTGQLSLTLEPVMVAEVVDAALGMVTPMAAQAGVGLPDAEALNVLRDRTIIADRQRLAQVLLNLFSNAVKYNQPGGEVKVTAIDSCDRRLRIEVSDTGCGIAPEMLTRLFTPFDRLDAEQRGIEGTGIGLVLSRRLVQSMGGTLSVESAPGEGATFAIELPLAADEPEPEEEKPEEPPSAVLYVAATLPHLAAIQHCLAEHPGVELIPVTSGWGALDLVRARRPRLVLLDLRISDSSAEQTVRAFCESPSLNGVPIAVIGGNETPRQITDLLRAGATHYFASPLEEYRLTNFFAEHLLPEAAAAA